MKMRYFFLLPLFMWPSPVPAGDTVPENGTPEKERFFDHLVAQNETGFAALEFERLRHFGGIDSVRLACDLGYAFLDRKEYGKAESYFELAASLAGNPSPGYGRAISGLVRTYILQGKAALAQNELDHLEQASLESVGEHERIFLRSVIYAARYKTDSALTSLKIIQADSTFANRASNLDTLLQWYNAQRFTNPLYAFIYSSAIPGWGHWYVGDQKKAAASFGLMALLGSVLCFEGYRMYDGNREQRYVYSMDMFLIWGLGWRRYYSSIRKAAHQKAVEHNRDIQVRFQDELAEIINVK